MRVVKAGYKARLAWREIPRKDIGKIIWAQLEDVTPVISTSALLTTSNQFLNTSQIFEPLTTPNQLLYRNQTAARHAPPNVVVEGNQSPLSAEIHVPCAGGRNPTYRNEDLPEGSFELSLQPLAESVVVTGDKVVFRKYDGASRRYEPTTTPDLTSSVWDFLFLHWRSKTVPCLLGGKEFADLVEVKMPHQYMYNDPGITPVPLKAFPAVLKRAQERKFRLSVECIDPNSLGRTLVLTFRQ